MIGKDFMGGSQETFTWLLSLLSAPDEHARLGSWVDEEEEAGNASFTEQPQRQRMESMLAAELLRQGVWQTTDTRLRFCVAAYLLWRHGNHASSSSGLGAQRIEEQLEQAYRSLAIIQWLTVTRGKITHDEGYL